MGMGMGYLLFWRNRYASFGVLLLFGFGVRLCNVTMHALDAFLLFWLGGAWVLVGEEGVCIYLGIDIHLK